MRSASLQVLDAPPQMDNEDSPQRLRGEADAALGENLHVMICTQEMRLPQRRPKNYWPTVLALDSNFNMSSAQRPDAQLKQVPILERFNKQLGKA